jgi:arylsulfatase A-like enzyme
MLLAMAFIDALANRRQFLGIAAGVAASPVLRGQGTRRPNVLYILADEWRAQSTGYNGDLNVRAAVLDRLASQCVNFDTAVSGTPVCCPHRASLMTGQYPLTNGVFINDVELKPKGTTFGEAFARAGYRTGYIGKWHLYGSPKGLYERRLAYIPLEKRFGFDYWKACECTHDYNKSLYYEGNDTTPKYWPGYDAFAQTDDACAFIGSQAQKSDPFCLVLSLGPPHFPLNTAPEKYQAMFQDRGIRLRENVPADKREEAITGLRGYYAHMAALDDCFAKLLASLDRAGIAEDTIVVFTSDHGDMMLSQGLTTKLHPWDESIRVPFLIRYPRKLGARGRTLRTPLNSPDIFPTLLGLAGIPVPGSVEGIDHSGLITGRVSESSEERGTLISLPVPITEARRYGFAEYRGLRTQRHTYVRSIHGPWLLYDNQTDPYQMHNQIGKPEAKQLQLRLDRELDAELKRRKDDFLPAAEYLRRAGLSHYREANVPVGRHPSPWGDWDSTLQGSPAAI